MDTVKPKRFSFSGFGTSLSRSLSFNSKPKATSLPTPPPEEQQATAEELEQQRRNRRAQKSKSLYVKSFRKSVQSDSSTKKSFDMSEAKQTNGKEVRNAIRRSLSAVLYASPHSSSSSRSEDTTNKLVPILVTPGLSDSVGGIMIDDGSTPLAETIEVAAVSAAETKKKKPVEYDNTLEVFCNKANDAVTILWQGYGYTVEDNKTEVASEMLVADNTKETPQDLEARFEKDVWESYRGLVHPLHLFLEKTDDVLDRGRWAGLSVTELRRYYDNYGSMMLKIRENRMIKQQQQYHYRPDVKNEWIIIPEGEAVKDKQQNGELSNI